MFVSKQLKYLFDSAPKLIIPDERLGKKIRQDKTIYRMKYNNMFSEDLEDEEEELIGIPFSMLCMDNADDEWEVIHLDGDYKNCKPDNLEAVIFVDGDPMIDFLNEIEELKKELVAKDEHIKKITFESKAKDGQVANMNKQVIYEQNRVKELNKEIRKMEKEIRRLLDITSAIHR